MGRGWGVLGKEREKGREQEGDSRVAVIFFSFPQNT